MRRPGIECGGILVHGKLWYKSLSRRLWTSRSNRIVSWENLVPWRRQEVFFSAPEQEPLTNPEYMASEGQLWRMHGMENVLAVRTTFIREFDWYTICHIRTRLFEIKASWKVVPFLLLKFQLNGARRKQRSVETLRGAMCTCANFHSDSSVQHVRGVVQFHPLCGAFGGPVVGLEFHVAT